MVSLDGFAKFTRWGLTFQFGYENGNTSVVVVKGVSIPVQDHIREEWCSYSGSIDDSTSRTFEWNLSNEIVNMREAYPTQIDCLGNGVLYDGFLNNSKFSLYAKNMNLGGSISTDLFLKVINRKSNEIEKEIGIGTLYDTGMEAVTGKTIPGNMSVDGLFSPALGGQHIGVKVDVGGSNNRLNMVWTSVQTWNSNCIVQEVGVLDRLSHAGSSEEEDTTIAVDFNGAYQDVPSTVTLTPVSTTTSSGSSLVLQYVVKVDGDETTYSVVDNKLNFLSANGTRYLVDLESEVVKRLVFREMDVLAFDFSTQYLPDQLRNNLTTNVKQAMMNQMVVAMMTSPAATRKQM